MENIVNEFGNKAEAEEEEAEAEEKAEGGEGRGRGEGVFWHIGKNNVNLTTCFDILANIMSI